MWLPLVSIILPAYNSEKYIAEAVNSVLAQVYDNFELIIINDGSSDNTLHIIESIKDPRIIILNNDSNKGLIYSLNRGIEAAKGELIARMDADDICTNDRIEKQVHWLLHHPYTAAVGCFIHVIDAHGKEKAPWLLDRKTVSAAEIRSAMISENCLAHPTLMIRTGILKKYQYSDAQKNIEDYDLWLRMLADGLVIEKIPQALLWYREHATSVTGAILKKQNPFLKKFHCKQNFIAAQLKAGKWGVFQTRVFISMLSDRAKAIAKDIKHRVKQ